MKIEINPKSTININSKITSLKGLYPILNGQILKNHKLEIVDKTKEKIVLIFSAKKPGEWEFGIEIIHKSKNSKILRYWIRNLNNDISLNNFGIRFESIENLRSYMRTGYHSWDGSFYVQPELIDSRILSETELGNGYAMTQLLPHFGDGSLILGFIRHDRFQHTFKFDNLQCPPSIDILSWWDQKDQTNGDRIESEDLLILEDIPEKGVIYKAEEGLREWARICASSAPDQPRLSANPITGWCSWYNLYGQITEESILKYLRRTTEIVRKNDCPMNVFLIDDGFTPEYGDWLQFRPEFPNGIKPLINEIENAGFIPGLWIAPFIVGNRSCLYKEHPDWVIKDRLTGGPLIQNRLYGEQRWSRQSEEHYILDTTHPEAFSYLYEVFHTWTHNWNCKFFKTDFMYFGSEYGPERALRYLPGESRIENWVRVARMIRNVIGDSIWLGCGCPLWASIGLVDAIRIGYDVGVEWTGEISAKSTIIDQATRNFANHIFWQTDPDCVLLRQDYHYLTENEVRSLAIHAGMTGGVMMTSDDLSLVSEGRLRLWRFLLNSEMRATCDFPFLGRSTMIPDHKKSKKLFSPQPERPIPIDPILVQIRMSKDKNGSNDPEKIAALFIFNTGEISLQRTFPIKLFGFTRPRYIHNWITGETPPKMVDEISVILEPHDGILFFLDCNPINTIPERLP